MNGIGADGAESDREYRRIVLAERRNGDNGNDMARSVVKAIVTASGGALRMAVSGC